MKIPKRPCSTPNCPGLREPGERYCPACAGSKPARERDERESATRRGYGAAHRRWREMVLARDPLCVMCKANGRIVPATVADHIVPIKRGGARFDMDNGQGLCHDCHNRKTQGER